MSQDYKESSNPRKTDLVKARANMATALTLEGYVSNSYPVCPNCAQAEKGKSKIFDDGAFKCHACGYWVANAIDFLTLPRVRKGGQLIGQALSQNTTDVTIRTSYVKSEAVLVLPLSEVSLEGGKWPFALAASALSGNDIPHPEGKQVVEVLTLKPQFLAVPNPELYQKVLNLGSVSAAQEFYGRWFIDPKIIEESKAVVITDQAALVAGLRSVFTAEQLIAAGLATPEGYLLVNAKYPVVEPHLLPDGRVAGLQFRASVIHEQAILAHKKYKSLDASLRIKAEKVPYVPKFLSLNGTSIAQRCGFGLPRLGQLLSLSSPNTLKTKKVYIVEGFKDVQAARTLGLEAYGLPGASLLPVKAVVRILSQFKEVHVSLDNDAAGEVGTAKLIKYLQTAGLSAIAHPPPVGMDITDVLIKKTTRPE